ncbi:tRNA (adenosine(37)-N6)-dimethylallyltransferase MiaA [Helicobacter cynogastricus]|uniref:tRNA (adenosine(37)-N6)-dimethylallyltransferase MiaA n=1 Tax=Helicobacter cynogastricus TaxID=329937 RepID=UPI000CF09D96|nr:tRNA (adenosine(37)-N6)-dimethylallyltransferase MiaA [Helicobacter cynogastricus]
MPSLFAILGPSGSGKSALALQLAQELDAEIFSLDSLSIYKDFNIAAAKPSAQDLARIKHYAIDILDISQPNNAIVFAQELQKALAFSSKRVLLLVGGSGFYLKSILEGLSPMPLVDEGVRARIKELANPYDFLIQVDPLYAQKIHPKDSYRLQKALEIYFGTQTPPSVYFATHPKIPFHLPVKLYTLSLPKEILRAQIAQRTKNMLKQGIVAEVESLAHQYGSHHQPFKAIGPKECLEYLQGKLNLAHLEEAIYTHTCQLAKRQITFNKNQFANIAHLERAGILEDIRARAIRLNS